ncbi:hypothetical protein Fmac_032204 [Flemingia macrophylla]|uniref:Uncharacterized protein n=1 Tax=Flemingia macrophylla TaxID=520843 RepID=A0ABD1L481_9FABA
MADSLRMTVAVLGNVAAVSLYAAPTVTFKRVIRKKSIEEFSCIPYIVALMNCLLFTWYGLPVVSNKWENFPLVTVNGAGILFELSYVLIYFWFSSPKGKASCESGHDSNTSSFSVLCHCCIIIFCLPRSSSPKASRGWCRLGDLNCNVFVPIGCNEASHTNQECGIHAPAFVFVFILSQFTVADLWNPHSGYFRCGTKYYWNSIRHTPARSPL